MGIERAVARAEKADLRVFLQRVPGEALPLAVRPGDLIVLGRADERGGWDGLAVSGLTGQGLESLMAAITRELSNRVLAVGVMVRERHAQAMERALAAVERAREFLERLHDGPEFVAAELWVAIRDLDMLVGKVDVELLLDEIFASFCIGK